jgi:EAL domain-containing protein (putative c-di-GMP-specific phosphodiesterase class I)
VALRALRARGVGLAFDDFGTGHASLSCVRRYPLTRIKIDRSFIQNIDSNSSAEETAVANSIIAMAHHLGLSVTAEGVETASQAAFLQSKGCHEVQGYFYARPLPKEQFRQFLAEWRPEKRRTA